MTRRPARATRESPWIDDPTGDEDERRAIEDEWDPAKLGLEV